MVNRMQFLQTHGKSLQANRKAFKHGPKSFEKNYVCWRKIVQQYVILDAAGEKSLHDPGDNFCQEAEKISHNFRKWGKQMFLSN